MKIPNQPTRRKFLHTSGLATLGLTAGASGQKRRALASTDKLNLAFIGPGGRGFSNLSALASENIVAFADVDDARASSAYRKYPDTARYRDFRAMLDKEAKNLDAVVISTPDHTHAIAAVAAMQHGLHVYCEKPLAHSIYEVHRMQQEAKKAGVITQMGQQGHAMEGSRRAVEVIRSGAIGEVEELHVWTDRPNGWWPQGAERPAGSPAVPKTLDWNLWLGPAPERPYHPDYVPFKWRGRWDFGTGPIGDMAVHNLDTAFWALELGLPKSAHVIDAAEATRDCPPLWSVTQLDYPARGNAPPAKLTSYDGKKLPPADLFQGEAIPTNGSLMIGSTGTLFTRTWHGGLTGDDMFMLLPHKQFVGYQPPPPTLPRTPDHHTEWALACKGGPPTQSNFDYAGNLTQGLLIGQLALRTRKKILWDPTTNRAINCPEADPFIRPEFRPGWEL